MVLLLVLARKVQSNYPSGVSLSLSFINEIFLAKHNDAQCYSSTWEVVVGNIMSWSHP